MALGVFKLKLSDLDSDDVAYDEFKGLYSRLVFSLFDPKHKRHDASITADKYDPAVIEELENVLKSGLERDCKDGSKYNLYSRLIDTAGDEDYVRVYAISCLKTEPARWNVFRNYGARITGGQSTSYCTNNTASIFQACRGSSAAPTFFPALSLPKLDGGSEVHCDGGIYINNPSHLVLREIERIWGPGTPIDVVISCGTGLPPAQNPVLPESQTKQMGQGVMAPLVQAVMGWTQLDALKLLQAGAADSLVGEQAIGGAMRMLPGTGAFMRFNVIDEAFNVFLDESDPVKLGRMRASAQRFMKMHPEVQQNLKVLRSLNNVKRQPYHEIL